MENEKRKSCGVSYKWDLINTLMYHVFSHYHSIEGYSNQSGESGPPPPPPAKKEKPLDLIKK